MEIVYILQIVTICITALTLVINVLITVLTNKQKNYNEIITNSRLEFMLRNRDNATRFIAEAKNIVLNPKWRNNVLDLKPLYTHFEQICMALKPYNTIDEEIIAAGNRIIELTEQAVLSKSLNEELPETIKEFARLVNIYDDADWKFIKQQFNTTTKKSEDFDKICNDIKAKYNQ